MGIFSSNKEMLSMLEDFKREADKRICRLEAIAKKSKSESVEMLADIKAYCEEANGNASISDVLDLMQTSNKRKILVPAAALPTLKGNCKHCVLI